MKKSILRVLLLILLAQVYSPWGIALWFRVSGNPKRHSFVPAPDSIREVHHAKDVREGLH